jgi:hypothetical protein
VCDECNLVVLRPLQYDRREVQFVLWDETILKEGEDKGEGDAEQGCADVRMLCRRVRPHMHLEIEGVPAFIGLHTAHRLVHPDKQPPSAGNPKDNANRALDVDLLVLPQPSRILTALSKLETDVMFIHAFFTGRSTRVFELPRYGLSFELRDGRLHSDNFVGFALAPRQQLVGMLHGFEQYLLLESVHEATPSLVLIPAGPVIRTTDGVVIDGSSSCDADRRHHVYEVSPRFGTVEARGRQSAIAARLQLAALYAATALRC